MRKKLTRHGNSLALVIDKPVLELLGVDADTMLDISTDGEVLLISPVKEGEAPKRRKRSAERLERRYARLRRRRGGL